MSTVAYYYYGHQKQNITAIIICRMPFLLMIDNPINLINWTEGNNTRYISKRSLNFRIYWFHYYYLINAANCRCGFQKLKKKTLYFEPTANRKQTISMTYLVHYIYIANHHPPAFWSFVSILYVEISNRFIYCLLLFLWSRRWIER